MKNSIVTLILLIVALVVIVKLQNFVKNNAPVPTATPGAGDVVCTSDAMMCPDGSYVGRSGPLCEFQCPGVTGVIATTTVSLGLNQTYEIASTSITIMAVTEDSRCAKDVQCIQAGRVRVAIQLVSPSGTSTMQVEPGMTITTETLAVTLDEVSPYPVSTHTILPSEYRFLISVKNK